jgi:4'-phosphopantetheinyl transferase
VQSPYRAHHGRQIAGVQGDASLSATDCDWAAFLATDVHVWRVRLDVRDSAFDDLLGVLSDEERDRARRFRFDHLQQQYTIAHGALRVLLGRYLSVAPDRLRFDEGSQGKPQLTVSPGPPAAIRFNLSHSNDLAVVAVAADRDIGVDIEALRPVPEMEEIARRYFSEQEAIDLMRSGGDAREQNFFRIWTRKEAFIKAIGEGLSCPLDSFAVSVDRDEAARVIQLHGDADAARAWQLHAFQPAPRYAGALAYRGDRLRLQIFTAFDGDALMKAAAGATLPPAQENH